MNELSWMIYAADVCGKVSFIAGILGPVGFAIGGFVGALAIVDGYREEGKAIHRWTLRLCPVFILLAVITPSQDTVYAMAASEMGEKVVQSQTANKAMQALNAWLDRQIAPEQSKSQGGKDAD